jgi:PEP-CTERM motif
MGRFSPFRTATVWAWLCSAMAFWTAGASGAITTVFTLGDQAPDTPTGAAFSEFNSPVLNNAGQIAFQGLLFNGGGGVNNTNDTGLWSGTPGTIGLVARTGDQAPGYAAGKVFAEDFYHLRAFYPALNGAGQVGFYSGVGDTGGYNIIDTNWIGLPGAPTLVAEESGVAPELNAGSTFKDLSPPLVSDTGQVAFSSWMNVVLSAGPPEVLNAIYAGLPGGLHRIAIESGLAPGTPEGAQFISIEDPVINAQGQMAFRAFLKQGLGGVTTGNDVGVWVGGSGASLVLVAREGNHAPGTAAGAVFDFFGTPTLNDGGQVIFAGYLKDGVGGVTPQNDNGIWAGPTYAPVLIARAGDIAPNTALSFNFFDVDDAYINAAGHVIFGAEVVDGGGAATRGIWTGTPGNLSLLALENTQAPGVPAGATFTKLSGNGITDSWGPVLNSNGQVLLHAKLNQGTGGVDGTNDEGLWLFGPDGDSVLVARSGDPLVGQTFAGALDVAAISDKENGRRSSLNDYGQVIFDSPGLGLYLYTPDLHWRGAASGSFDNQVNWSLSLPPAYVHDAFIDPGADATVFGPASVKTVKSLTVGGGAGAATLNMLSSGSITAVSNNVTVLANGVLTGQGQVAADVYNGGTVRADNLTIQGTLFNTGTVTGYGNLFTSLFNQAGGTVLVTSGQVLRLLGTAHTNAGLIDVNGGELTVDGQMNSSGVFTQITARDATLRFNGGLLNQAKLSFFSGFNQVQGDVDNTGTVLLSGGASAEFLGAFVNNGNVQVSSGSDLALRGDTSGVGGYSGTGLVTFDSTTRPGLSAALILFGGDAVFTSNAWLEIELAGTVTPGLDFDRLEIANILSLAGTLDVEPINGFVPNVGDTFQIITAAVIRGRFDRVVTGAGLSVQVLYDPGSVTLLVTGVDLIGDLNGDGFVGIADLNLVLGNWNQTIPPGDPLADPSGDGFVGIADLNTVLGNWNAGTPPPLAEASTTIPEPGTLALMGLDGLIAIRRR